MSPAVIVGVLALLGVAGIAWNMRRGVLAEAGQGAGGELLPWLSLSNAAEEAGALFGGSILGPNAAGNLNAFLAMIRKAEGTAGSPDPYRVLFGGRLFDGYADHPRRAVQFTDKAGRKLWTSAAGAYQFMAVSPLPDGSGRSTRVDTWDRLKRKLALPDFSPASQNRAAIELIDEAGALLDVQAGRFDTAVFKVRRIWASLPGAGYAQGERSMAWARDAYIDAGGMIG